MSHRKMVDENMGGAQSGFMNNGDLIMVRCVCEELADALDKMQEKIDELDSEMPRALEGESDG